MTQKNDTKERIEEIALNLFSVYGYNYVSIRNICKELGYTESSIYYHFKNKQAIMDSLISKVNKLMETMIANFDQQFKKVDHVSVDEMCYVAVGVLTGYLLNPYVFKIISMLTIEMLSNKQAYETYQNLVFRIPLKQQEEVFGQMVQRGFIKEDDPARLAQQYYSIIYLSFQKYCIGQALEDSNVLLASDEISKNIKSFYTRLMN